MKELLTHLPKLELHAHLNGSLNINSIQELGERLYGTNTEEFRALCQKFIDFDAKLELDACFQKFAFMHELTSTKKGLSLATQFVIRDFAKDHVVYLELRTTPKANNEMTKEEYLMCVIDSIATSEEVIAGDIIVKLLPSIDRSQSLSAAEETMQLVLKLQQQFPRLITGVDLSGNPHHATFKSFVPSLQKAKEHGLKLTLHCAEIDNPTEVAEMISFGMHRCGHGTFLSKTQITELNRLSIPVECCLTSNVKSRTVSSYADHHFKNLLAESNAVVLCTDDSGVFDTTLTNEFLIATEVFHLTKEKLLDLSLHAVNFAFTDNAEKGILREKIVTYFNKYNV